MARSSKNRAKRRVQKGMTREVRRRVHQKLNRLLESGDISQAEYDALQIDHQAAMVKARGVKNARDKAT